MKLGGLLWFVSVFLIATTVVGQEDASFQTKSFTITKLDPESKIILDGVIDDSTWLEMVPISNFTMRIPVVGAQPSERTEVRLCYDEENIYIAAILYESEPSGIKAFQKKRDQDEDTDDEFVWFFDTYLDKRNAYIFAINPLGVKTDALLFTGQGSSFNINWDGIWYAKTQMGDFGWSAEIKIPFRTLNFNPDNDTWGINFRRTIRRKNELAIWSGYELNQGILRPQNGGVMTGLKDISQGIGLEVVPFLNIKNEKSGNEDSETDFQAGFDLNYNITTNLKASFTLNTDFAETEVDDRQINLTRFPLQFPEKRDFFLEGGSIYEYAPRSGIDPYFSRRIGLSGGNQIPIKYGARILGRVANLDLALMQVRTSETDELAAEDFTVARFKQNFGTESTLGFVYTRRSTEDGESLPDPLQTRHTYGADIQLNTSTFLTNKNLQFQAFFTFHNPESPLDTETNIWDRSSRGIRINFPNQPWSGHCSYREFGTDFDPAVGFNRRNGFRRVEPSIGFAPLFEKSDLIRQISWRVSYENLWNLDFDLLTQNLRISLANIRFESGDYIEFDLIKSYERLDEDFDILRNDEIFIPLGEYPNWTFDVELRSAKFRKIVGSFDYRYGGFWSGTRSSYKLGIVVRPMSGLNLGVEYSITDVVLKEGSFQTRLFRFEGGFDVSTSISFSSIIQYDNLSNALGMNYRLRWIVTPGSDIYLVYNHNWLKEDAEYRLLDRSSILKANYTHRF